MSVGLYKKSGTARIAMDTQVKYFCMESNDSTIFNAFGI